MEEIDSKKWEEEYQRLLIEEVGMSEEAAEAHLKSAADFDYGYSALFYITEEGLLDKRYKTNE